MHGWVERHCLVCRFRNLRTRRRLAKEEESVVVDPILILRNNENVVSARRVISLYNTVKT